MFKDKLKELRKQKNISQEDTGKIANVTKATVSNWEKGKGIADGNQLPLLADFFNVTTDYLLDFTQDDIDKIKNLKQALKNAGMMNGDDLTIEELQKALNIVEMLKEKKDDK